MWPQECRQWGWGPRGSSCSPPSPSWHSGVNGGPQYGGDAGGYPRRHRAEGCPEEEEEEAPQSKGECAATAPQCWPHTWTALVLAPHVSVGPHACHHGAHAHVCPGVTVVPMPTCVWGSPRCRQHDPPELVAQAEPPCPSITTGVTGSPEPAVPQRGRGAEPGTSPLAEQPGLRALVPQFPKLSPHSHWIQHSSRRPGAASGTPHHHPAKLIERVCVMVAFRLKTRSHRVPLCCKRGTGVRS